MHRVTQGQRMRVVMALGLLTWLVGCSVASYERRSDGAVQTLKERGIEAHHGKILRVFRF